MNIFKRLFKRKNKKKVIATVIEKQRIPSTTIPIESLSKTVFITTPEKFKVYLKSGKHKHYIDSKDLFYRLKVGDVIKVMLVEEYSSKGEFLGYNFELPTIK